jgi:origin recognition complex subunit 1
MYLSGGTGNFKNKKGTGKTLCTKYIVSQIIKESIEKDVRSIYINAIKTTPKVIIKEIWEKIKDMYGEEFDSLMDLKKTKTKTALKGIKTNEYFTKKMKNKKYIIIIIDELDYMLTREQKELYEIFNWSQYDESHLTIIGISNTINLPQKLLPKIASRIEITQQIIFPTVHNIHKIKYDYTQIYQILKDRVDELSIFEEKALEYCSKKISNSWGDIR